MRITIDHTDSRLIIQTPCGNISIEVISNGTVKLMYPHNISGKPRILPEHGLNREVVTLYEDEYERQQNEPDKT